MTRINEDCREHYLDLLKKALTAYIYPESYYTSIGNVRNEHQSMLWQFVKKRIIEVLRKRDLEVVRLSSCNPEARRDGKDWPFFGYTMVGLRRLENLQNCIREIVARGVPGDVLEAGVWRGGAAIFMQAALQVYSRERQERMLWLADSFAGLPKPFTAQDKERRGYDLSDVAYLKVSAEEVQENFERFGLFDDWIRFLKGWFKDTLPTAPIERLALLRVDGDLYESTLDVLNALYFKVSPGGFVVIDDYHSWPPCKKAVSDFRERHGITEEILEIDGSGVYWQIFSPDIS